MTVLLAAILTIAAFLIGFSILGIVGTARRALSTTSGALGALRDETLSDDEKEAMTQKAALSLLMSVWQLLWRFLVCLAFTYLPIWAFDAFGLVLASETIGFLSRIDVLVVSTLVVSAGLFLFFKLSGSSSSDYSALDRLIHRIAFSRPFVQFTAVDVEDSAFKAVYEDTVSGPPVFVTALPRAGTTALLTALAEIPQLATHTYRDMPFVMAPVFWSRLGGAFQKSARLQDRAHGDGLKIGYDSPEAFEDVLWRMFWPEKFRETGIELWAETDLNADTTEFFRKHFQKITALRSGTTGRYISKNNGNIARLGFLPRMFPDATVIVPFRDPVEHAASLHRQHLNFLSRHAEDPFSKRYMEDIGHLEFGELHRPVNFEGSEALIGPYSAQDQNYWLAYWIAAHQSILSSASDLVLVDHADLCQSPVETLNMLCKSAGISSSDTDFSQHLHPVKRQANPADFDNELLAKAEPLFAQLKGKAMGPHSKPSPA